MLGLIGIVLCDGIWIVVSAAVLGFAASVTFVVTFGLPAILSPPDDVHRMAGGMFTISYTIAVIVPIVCGALWDLTGLPWTAFVPMALCGVALTIFGTMLTLRRSAHLRTTHGMDLSVCRRPVRDGLGHRPEIHRGLLAPRASLLTVAAMIVSLALLGLALKTLPVGTAYAVWTGIGAVGTAALGIYLFGEPATAARLASMGLIVAGIVGLKLVT